VPLIPEGFIDIFSRKTAGFHKQAKHFEPKLSPDD